MNKHSTPTCIMPEMPYCPCCKYGAEILPAWVETREDLPYCTVEWYCSLQHQKMEDDKMNKLTSDSPIGNTARALNFFYVKDNETWARTGDKKRGEPDESLYDHIRRAAAAIDAEIHAENNDELGADLYEALFEGIDTKSGALAHYYTAAWVASELRAHLKCYEESGMPLITPEGMSTIDAAIIEYGENAQVDMAIEEMAELTKAICKRKRTGATGPEAVAARGQLLEEVADVFIMLVQLIRIFDGAEEVQQTVTEKLDRLKGRLERRKDHE